ncbi:MAG: MFS transporter, partial [Sphingobium sp.]
MRTGDAPSSRWPKRATVLVLCFLATFVCFLDRVNMSVAVIAMQKEFGWSEATKGLVLASFFVGYLIFQVPSGRLASRFGGRYVMAAAIIWWSLFTILTPLAAMVSLPLLLLVRVGMGLGEAATFPAAYNLGARWFPPTERSRFVGVLLSGIPIGTLFALTTTGAIVDSWSWHSVFYLFGSIGIVLALVWLVLIRNSPAEHPGVSAAERDLLQQGGAVAHGTRVTPWRKLLSQPAVWALIVNHFCCNWILYVLLT